MSTNKPDRSAGREPPLPPSSKSIGANGLKQTPANRALNPEMTPHEVFRKRAVKRRAFYADRRHLVFSDPVEDTLRFLKKHEIEVDCIVTSPPFYGQRDYGFEGQIGLEKHPREYIKRLMQVFDLCLPVLKKTGSLWVNLGDTYWSGKGATKSGEKKQPARRFGIRPQDKPGDGIWTKPKQLLLVPHRFAIAMQDAGWLVRNDNVWIKPNPIPDQVRDRCSISHEYVFHFTKERWYYFNRHIVGREMPSGSTMPPLDTWQIPPSRGAKGHKAAFSEELVRIPVLATTPPQGIVLDPFAGSGTTLGFASKHGFRSIAIDMKPEYCEQTVKLLKGVSSGD